MPNLADKILDLPQLGAWRQARGGRPPVVVTGAFDLLHPGNLAALTAASRLGGAVCVLLEPDPLPTLQGTFHQPLSIRAEFMAHLRDVAAVIPAQGDPEIWLPRLAPFTWVGCSRRASLSPLARAARASAAERHELVPLPGLFAADLRAAVQAGHTPLSLPDAYPVPVRAAGPRPGGLGLRVTVNGCFDVLHIGHVRFLAQARALGRYLTVLINDDASIRRYKGPARPIFPCRFREAALGALEAVDAVVAFAEDDPLPMLSKLRPDIHVKGGSYEEARVRNEKALLESWGGRLEFCPLSEGFSTTTLVNALQRDAAPKSCGPA